MSRDITRREMLGHATRGAALLGMGGVTALLTVKAHKTYAWEIDANQCINSRLGALGVEICDRCASDCVLPLSAVRAVNDYSRCGR
ncbi:MAG: hypothetical protein V3T72_08325, partial [Thermoanaerobaculia bacterium]